MDRRTLFGVAVILLLFSAWGIGNLMYTMPHIYGGGEIMPEYDFDERQGEAAYIEAGGVIVLFRIVVIIIVAAGVIGIVIGILQKDKDMVVDIGAGLVGLVIGLVIFSGAYWFMYRLPDMEDIGDTTNGQGAGETVSGFFFGSIGGLMILLVCIAFVALVVFSKMKVYLDKKIVAPEEKDVKDMVSQALDKTVDDLYSGKDIRSTIMRCYQQMCLALEDTGVSNAEFMTPREFTKLAIAKLDISRNTLKEMTKLFEEARYSVHELGDDMRNRALKNLNLLKDDLGGMKDEGN